MNAWMEAVTRNIVFNHPKGQLTVNQIATSKDFKSLVTMRRDIRKELEEANDDEYSFVANKQPKNTFENEVRFAVLTDILEAEKVRQAKAARKLEINERLALLNELDKRDDIKKAEAMTPEEREKERQRLLSLE